MRSLSRWVISILGSAVLVLGMWTLPALGQGGNPPASTKESGQTSGKGQTAVEQKANTGMEKTITGCLSGPNAEGAYTLSTKNQKQVGVSSSQGVDLKEHVGHEVKLTGSWMKSGAAMGTKEKAGEKAEQHFEATKVEHIASSCTAGASKTKGEKSKD